MLGPPGEFSDAFGYLIKNQYILEHLKSISLLMTNSHFKIGGKMLGK